MQSNLDFRLHFLNLQDVPGFEIPHDSFSLIGDDAPFFDQKYQIQKVMACETMA
jgi:hypothetical protein